MSPARSSFPRRIALPLVALAAVATACTDDPTTALRATAPALPATPSLNVVDAANGTGGRRHFFFLPPMVAQPKTTGAFDGTQRPTVQICERVNGACAKVVATYTAGSGPNGETVKVDGPNQFYLVNWHTDQFATSPTATYRVRVLFGVNADKEFGHADVQVVANQGQAKNAASGAAITLVNGRTLPIKFRVEQGAFTEKTVSAATGGTVSSGTKVAVAIPAGALIEATTISVEAIAPPRTSSTAPQPVEGTTYEFGPDGTQFTQPVEIKIAYDPAKLTGTSESALRLFRFDEAAHRWRIVPGSRVDPVRNTVVGLTTHFSTYAVLAATSVSAGGWSSCAITPAGPTYCWGSGALGSATDYYMQHSATPLRMATTQTFTAVTQSVYHGCGVNGTGMAYCWGFDSAGLGTGEHAFYSPTPVPVTMPAGVAFRDLRTSEGLSCATALGTGEVYCWGIYGNGQTGTPMGDPNDMMSYYVLTPTKVTGSGSGNLRFKSVAVAGMSHACAVSDSVDMAMDPGAIYCWGDNYEGQLGATVAGGSNVPVHVPGTGWQAGAPYRSLALGQGFTCGLSEAGELRCWGNGGMQPQVIVHPAGQPWLQVEAGHATLCAVAGGTDTGAVYCWRRQPWWGALAGLGSDGRVLNSGPGGDVYTSVSVGYDHACGVRDDDVVLCWGDNGSGQLGTGTMSGSGGPSAVMMPVP
jgi:alpha-tubulin suppressor-like RCC1 family protein